LFNDGFPGNNFSSVFIQGICIYFTIELVSSKRILQCKSKSIAGPDKADERKFKSKVGVSQEQTDALFQAWNIER